MKPRRPTRQRHGFSLLELVVVLLSLFVLAILLLPALSAPRVKNALTCMNQLKHTGSDLRAFEGEQGEKFASAIAATNSLGVAETIFGAMSNELSSTRFLVCPADRRRVPASSFHTLTSRNLSYFVNLDASEADPEDILMGDDNLTVRGVRVKSGVLVITNNAPISWTADRHRLCGNVVLADGSVQAVNHLSLGARLCDATNRVTGAGSVIARLAIP